MLTNLAKIQEKSKEVNEFILGYRSKLRSLRASLRRQCIGADAASVSEYQLY